MGVRVLYKKYKKYDITLTSVFGNFPLSFWIDSTGQVTAWEENRPFIMLPILNPRVFVADLMKKKNCTNRNANNTLCGPDFGYELKRQAFIKALKDSIES